MTENARKHNCRRHRKSQPHLLYRAQTLSAVTDVVPMYIFQTWIYLQLACNRAIKQKFARNRKNYPSGNLNNWKISNLYQPTCGASPIAAELWCIFVHLGCFTRLVGYNHFVTHPKTTLLVLRSAANLIQCLYWSTCRATVFKQVQNLEATLYQLYEKG